MQMFMSANARRGWISHFEWEPRDPIYGPLLFNVFINDMYLFINKCTLYNYDNSLSCATTRVEENINLQMEGGEALQWFTDNRIWWLYRSNLVE